MTTNLCSPVKRSVSAVILGGVVALLGGVALAAPGNDNFTARTVLSGTNASFQGSNVGATGEFGEPPPPSSYLNNNNPPSDITNSVWYRWTAPAAGGVVIDVTTTGGFSAPMLAVYTNSTLATLGLVGASSINFSHARVAFTAVSNATYQISVEGSYLAGAITNAGNFSGTLVATPPPANDLFANRSVIPGVYFTTAGSFLGASREPGEPAGSPAFPQTLWWSWTAPTNLGNTSLPVRLTADSVSWNPSIGVYTGSVVNVLSAVPAASATNGFANGQFSSTHVATFLAKPGVTYQISVGGYGGDSGGLTVSPRFGNYRFRLNATGLGLTLNNFTATDNFDGGNYDSWSFSGTAIVANSGPASTRPLRVLAFTTSGVSVLGPDSGYAVTNQSYWFTNNLGVLTNGQSLSLTVTGTIPAAVVNNNIGVGYGAYVELDEQPFSNTWYAVDQSLIGYADWPGLFGSQGPGAGAIRLDPDYIGLSAFNPLSSVSILGPTNVYEGSSMTYSGQAVYANNSTYNFTNTAWSASKFAITTNGVFTTGALTSNTMVSVDAPYSSSGLLYNAVTNISVVTLPPPTLNAHEYSTNRNFVLTSIGVSSRNQVIAAATNLTPPVAWTPLITNQAGTNGVLYYTNVITTNFQTRFFRTQQM